MRKSFLRLAPALLLSACMRAEPDTTSSTASPFAFAEPDAIRTHAAEGCTAVQAELLALPRELVRDRCRCYARRTVARLDEDEIASYRRTGLFDETARQKAFASLEACGLQRPE